MAALELLDAECAVLADALRARRVPKERRAEARSLLQRAWAFQSASEEPADELAALALVDLIEALIRGSTPGPIGRPLRAIARLSDRGPVLIRRLARPSPFAAIADRYLRVGKRTDARVEWFWKRCEQHQPAAKKAETVGDKAAKEFAADDLEYVWGTKKRPG